MYSNEEGELIRLHNLFLLNLIGQYIHEIRHSVKNSMIKEISSLLFAFVICGCQLII